MSTSTDTNDGDYSTLGEGTTDFERYADVSLEGGAVIIYDRENPDAWIQTTANLGLESVA